MYTTQYNAFQLLFQHHWLLDDRLIYCVCVILVSYQIKWCLNYFKSCVAFFLSSLLRLGCHTRNPKNEDFFAAVWVWEVSIDVWNPFFFVAVNLALSRILNFIIIPKLFWTFQTYRKCNLCKIQYITFFHTIQFIWKHDLSHVAPFFQMKVSYSNSLQCNEKWLYHRLLITAFPGFNQICTVKVHVQKTMICLWLVKLSFE